MVATLGLAIVNVIGLLIASSYIAQQRFILVCRGGEYLLATPGSFADSFCFQDELHERPEDAISYLGQAALIGCLYLWGTTWSSNCFSRDGGNLCWGHCCRPFRSGQVRPKLNTAFIWRRDLDPGEMELAGQAGGVLQPTGVSLGSGLSIRICACRNLSISFQLAALMNPVLLSSNNLIMASIAQHRQQDARIPGSAMKYMFYSGGIAAVYFVILLVGGSRVLTLFYGKNSTYLLNAPFLPIFVAGYALEFVSMFAGAILAGMEKTKALFIQQVWAMLVAICVVLPLVVRFGLQAAVATLSSTP